MSDEEFERHKEALAVKKLEKPKTVFSQFVQFYSEISLAQYHFDRNEAEVAILRNITKDELLQCYNVCFKTLLITKKKNKLFFQSFIAPDSVDRRVLAVHIVSTQTTQDEEVVEHILKRHAKISDVVAFKSSKELFPLMSPFLNIKAKGARSKL